MVLASAALLLGACDGGSQESPPTPTPTPTEVDGAYCGLVTTSLITPVLGDDVKVKAPNLVSAAPGTGSVECRMSANTTGVSYITVVADPDTGSPTPKKVDQRSDGCRPVTVKGWGPVTACWRDKWVSIAAYPPTEGRFLSIAVRLDEPGAERKATDGQLQEMTDLGVRVAEDVNNNLDRF
ncbi:hypothetical protein [Aeromicrobium ginsengisoli]|uniref:DUF3558 domain-containing protein n=1 Tax=Aeromicrobium ginsengisoli TaxID=363867 RepID=A0A5M4FH97_9ACTN|nr:hypothetical protein [Aeromicrobium ginsengisoli]KAA1399460.1 hypothetical protein ESP70_001430 [Aeromicrobium ginsengisoli]